jgi:hypothetical protein
VSAVGRHDPKALPGRQPARQGSEASKLASGANDVQAQENFVSFVEDAVSRFHCLWPATNNAGLTYFHSAQFLWGRSDWQSASSVKTHRALQQPLESFIAAPLDQNHDQNDTDDA